MRTIGVVATTGARAASRCWGCQRPAGGVAGGGVTAPGTSGGPAADTSVDGVDGAGGAGGVAGVDGAAVEIESSDGVAPSPVAASRRAISLRITSTSSGEASTVSSGSASSVAGLGADLVEPHRVGLERELDVDRVIVDRVIVDGRVAASVHASVSASSLGASLADG